MKGTFKLLLLIVAVQMHVQVNKDYRMHTKQENLVATNFNLLNI